MTAEGRPRRLYGMVEDDLASPRDPVFAGRVSELQAAIARLGSSERKFCRDYVRMPVDKVEVGDRQIRITG